MTGFRAEIGAIDNDLNARDSNFDRTKKSSPDLDADESKATSNYEEDFEEIDEEI